MRPVLLVFVLALALALAGCGDGEGGGAQPAIESGDAFATVLGGDAAGRRVTLTGTAYPLSSRALVVADGDRALFVATRPQGADEAISGGDTVRVIGRVQEFDDVTHTRVIGDLTTASGRRGIEPEARAALNAAAESGTAYVDDALVAVN